jgi:nucleotide-binding universal stress UspA family protein
MYTKILVPLDGSPLAEQIVPYARAIAEASKIPVELLRVNVPSTMTAYAPPLGGGDYLAAVAARFFHQNVAVTFQVELGDPAQAIVDRAAADRGTLIAMATHGLSGIQRLFLGSVAYKVVRMTTNPLLLVRPEQERDPAIPIQLNSVFVPLDGSGLTEKIFPFVIGMAKSMNLEVCLVRIFSLPTESYVVGEGILIGAAQRMRDDIRREVDDYLNGKVQELQAEGLARVSAIAVEGDAAEQIIDVARKTPDNLIAMSTHGRSGIERWVLGSVTEKVIHHSRDPVLVIRPS